MKAMYYEQFGAAPTIESLPDPICADDSVVIAVKASGICLSDWHGWQGHDPDINLPHVPGHEFAGEIVEVGKNVTKLGIGQMVTVPFVGGCGKCIYCKKGDPQVCPQQFQPGFTNWGSFAQYVEVQYAEFNVVVLPHKMAFEDAASLGCRFSTAFRAVVHQARLESGEIVAIHGCGGVGLSAILIAKALGAIVVAIDPSPHALSLAKEINADLTIESTNSSDINEQLISSFGQKASVSIDSYGSISSSQNSIKCLDRRGRHVQVGLITENSGQVSIPMSQIIGHELEIIGSHGIQASRYNEIFSFIQQHDIKLKHMIRQRCTLEQGIGVLTQLNSIHHAGISVITQFD